MIEYPLSHSVVSTWCLGKQFDIYDIASREQLDEVCPRPVRGHAEGQVSVHGQKIQSVEISVESGVCVVLWERISLAGYAFHFGAFVDVFQSC